MHAFRSAWTAATRFAAVAVVAGLLAGPATAQIDPGECVFLPLPPENVARRPSYEEWLGLFSAPLRVGPGRSAWRHDVPIEQSSRYWRDYWADVEGRGGAPALDSHILAFAVFSPDMNCSGYISRWIDEARAFGDIVIPEPEPGNFIVFHAGTPPDWIERTIVQYYGDRHHWPAAAIAVIIDAYRALQ